MPPRILIAYATWHGQSEKIARRIADVAFLEHVSADVAEVRQASLEHYDAVIVVGSVHFGRYERPLRRFIARRLTALARMRSAFVSVSGAAASLQGSAQAQSYIDRFLHATRWKPDAVLSVAGAVPFTRYNILTRAAMKFASRISGRESDTSRDYEYTDWFAVDAFVRDFIGVTARTGLG
jgi:menaquinone-dependent protoporphyrinogen oxidase